VKQIKSNESTSLIKPNQIDMNAAYRRLGLPIAGLALAQTFTTSSKTGDKLSSHAKHTTQAESATKQQQQQTSKPRPKLLFVGTGSSTGCPKPLCSMLFGTHAGSKQTTTAAAAKELSPEIQRLQAQYRDKCKTSRAASQGDPKDNKDYRNNPSLLISHCPDPQDGGEVKNIIIDAGKTFREGALRWFPKHDIATLDAIILTHVSNMRDIYIYVHICTCVMNLSFSRLMCFTEYY